MRISVALLAAYVAAGAGVGVAAGVLSRLAMRGVVYVVGGEPAFSAEGTVGIVFLFVLLGLIVSAGYLVAMRWLPKRIAWRAAIVTGVLLTITVPFFYLVATGDVPDQPTGRIAALVLLFVPLPVLMGLGIVVWGDRLEKRFMQGGDESIGVGWSIVFVVMPIVLILNMVGAAQTAMRHPMLVSRSMGRITLTGGAALNMSVVQSRALLIAVACVGIWAALSAVIFYRDAQAGRSPLRATLLMALPIFTWMAVGTLPPFLAWLPDSDVLLGMAQAIGVALLILVVALSEPERPVPRWTTTVCGVAWIVVAAWLIVPVLRGNWAVEWMAWVAMAVALSTLIALRPRSGGGWHLSTLLLAGFALMWLLLWAAGASVNGLMLAGYSGYQTALSAPVYWVVWLLLPVAGLTTARIETETRAPLAAPLAK